MADAMVQLDDIHHAYGSARSENDSVLRGLDLTVQAGEFVAVCGLSGSGKSTLLSIIGGILLPSRGRAQVGGCDLLHLGDGELSALRNRMIGFVFQDYHLAPVLTALENAMVPALLGGKSARQARSRALEKLEQVGLADKADALPSELSGGQMQRVAIARALVNDPPLLLADEPTGNLDEQTGTDVLALLGRYHRERGLTVVMATHDLGVEAHANRQLRLVAGQLHNADQASEPRA